MQIVSNSQIIQDISRSVVTVGNFDGIHNGHKYLLESVRERAYINNAHSVVITFEPHTRAFLNPDKTPPRLTTFKEKALILREYGIDYLVCLPFDRELATLSPEKFITTILINRYKAIEWVMGKNHTFGKDRKGSDEILHKLPVKNHFNVFTLDLHTEDTIVASSTRIRELIGQSKIDGAVSMLGHSYLILAERIRGMRIGFELGFPTLNFKCPPSQKVIPPSGVYAARVEYKDNILSGALYCGNCPTYENRDFHFEFHSLDEVLVDPGINTEACLWLRSFIRPDKTFATEDLLVDQIRKDIITIKKIFNKE